MKPTSHRRKSQQDQAAALIIVLAFVVLLTGLAVAYLSRATTDRQLAQSSFSDTSADLLARSALDIVVGDFRQEIVNGSTDIAPTAPTPFYSPTVAANVVPQRSGNPLFALPEANDPIPNLIRCSVRNDPNLAPPGVGSRASAVNSTTDVSTNGRFISRDRWNEHYLIPRLDLTAADNVTTPRAEFTPPDWVIVTRNGPAAFPSWQDSLKDTTLTNNNYAVGRYAYAVYDEGGLLDINVAGYPIAATPLTVTDIGRKGVLAMADLTTLPTTPGNFVSTAAINKFVGFRNYATTLQSGVTSMNFSFSPDAGNFVNYYLGSPKIGTSRDFGNVNTALSSGRTDQSFITRGELIKFQRNAAPGGIASANTLQYLGTFSREKNIPTWRANGTTTNQIENNLNLGRFYMGNLDLIRPPPGNGQPSGVQQAIGLHWNKGTAPNIGYWAYHGPTNPNALDHIPALTGPSRHFAGLLNYALNKRGDDDYSNLGQTLALCAALIDQYDDATVVEPVSGSTTTIISYNTAGSPAIEGNAYAYGMEKVDPALPVWAPSPPPGFDNQLDRPFRNAGDLGYIFRQACIRPDHSLDFSTAASLDSPVLDLFTYNNAPVRSGTISLNTRQPAALAAVINKAITTNATSATVSSTTDAMNAATAIVNAAATEPALSRSDIGRLASQVNAPPFVAGAIDEIRETIPRALVECVQTRTWGLLIDLVAQTGHYAPNATDLPQFIVDGEKRYWLHVAVDRFDGSIVGQQLEEVTE